MRRGSEDRLAPLVRPLVEKMGYRIVELKSQATRDAFRVALVIYKAEGVGLDDCTAVYRAVLPRIGMSEDRRDVHLEVSSPGMFRSIKTADEFAVFEGKDVKLMTSKSAEWIGGTIRSASNDGVVLERDGELREYPFTDIAKARLDSPQEVGK